jgi:pimeloyl-ACP methyl ester carboxylesterase
MRRSETVSGKVPPQTFEFQGCRLAYRIEGSGPPLLMIQGVGAEGLAYNPLVEILRDHYTCLTFDNRGIGASQPVGRRPTVEQMATDVLVIMDHVGWEAAHLLGHSLGGLIAMQVGLMAKPRVRTLALLCTFSRGAVTRMKLSVLWIALRLKLGTRRMRRQAFMDLVMPPRPFRHYPYPVEERLSAVLGHDLADAPEITPQQLEATRRHDLTARLPELSGIPTLVISGDVDKLASPASGREIAAAIDGARYVEIPGGSHAFPILEPERCTAILWQHLREAEHRSLP